MRIGTFWWWLSVRQRISARRMAAKADTWWRWWSAGGAEAVARRIASGSWDGLDQEVSRRLARIHPDLQWETVPGTSSKHILCISAAGLPHVRATAERVVRLAPPPTSTWEYRPARLRQTFASAVSGPWGRLALGDARYRITTDDRHQRVGVAVYHPLFEGLSGTQSLTAASLLVDWALGEDEVIRWVGEVTTVTAKPVGSMSADELATAVQAFSDRHRELEWALLDFPSSDGRSILMATARRPLRWIGHPLYDQYLAVTVTCKCDGLGWPTDEGLRWLRAAEDELVGILDGVAFLAAHHTGVGCRRLHFYADGHDPRAAAAVRRWVRQNSARAKVSVRSDPGWQSVQMFH